MYARLISLSGVERESYTNATQMMREMMIPMLRGYEGYLGYIGLYEPDSKRAKGLLFWATKDAAEAAEETLAERRQEMTSSFGMTLEPTELYEAPLLVLEPVGG
jgi:hypothetical protein